MGQPTRRAGGRLALRLRDEGPLLALLAAFAATRLVARLVFGLRFDASTFGYWQVLDVPLLRDDLLRSLLYLHSQPPLHNLVLGAVLKASPEALVPRVFEALFLVLGFLLLAGIHALLLELGTPPRAALAAALLQTFSTTWLVYEAWLFYTLPTAVLVTWAAVWLARAARGRPRPAMAYAAAVAALSWTRASYPPAFAAVALALLVAAAPLPAVRRVALRSSLLAFAFAVALAAKNLVLVGSFATSTWLGMSLARMTTEGLPAATREEWVSRGLLEETALVPAFSPLADYPPELRMVPPGLPAHPALAAERKADGSPNLNHGAYLRIGASCRRAAVTVVRLRPDVYLRQLGRAFRTWLRPPTDYDFVAPARRALGGWDRLHSRLLLGSGEGRRKNGPTLVLVPAALLVLAALLLRPREERRRILLVLAFPALAIAANLAGNLVEVEENNRFRVEVEGLMVAVGSWGLVDAARALFRGRRRIGS
ncbi:MAG TPA: hypothetical protein VGB87_05760 [Vicinamibacteria bacterium]